MKTVHFPCQALFFLRVCALGSLGCVASSCAPGDSHNEGCEQRFQTSCACPGGKVGQVACVDGKPGPCRCPETAAPVMDAGRGSSFGNSDAGPPRMLPDAMPMGQADGRQIEVDTMCGEQESQAVIGDERPVDVIFIIDNSGSMSDEIAAVERNINLNFAQIIAASAADYRVIMLSDHGSANLNVCVEPPLAALPCTESTSSAGSTMGAPANGERFFHYDINVQSLDSVCLMLSHYQTDATAGPLPQTGREASPTGWNEFLRAGSLKVFVEISDDKLRCNATTNTSWNFSGDDTTAASATQLARQVYRAIVGLSSEQFGTLEEPKFIWHSIVGIEDNEPVELPYTHFDPPALTGRCATAGNAGNAYQMLSISTGGLRYPVCAADAGHGYDAVFRAIAHEVIRGSRVECAFNIPTPPPGKFVDYESVKVQYKPGSGGAAEDFGRVKSDACNNRSFYYEDSEIKLCPAACERVRADELANVSVVFGCGPEVVLDPDIL